MLFWTPFFFILQTKHIGHTGLEQQIYDRLNFFDELSV